MTKLKVLGVLAAFGCVSFFAGCSSDSQAAASIVGAGPEMNESVYGDVLGDTTVPLVGYKGNGDSKGVVGSVNVGNDEDSLYITITTKDNLNNLQLFVGSEDSLKALRDADYSFDAFLKPEINKKAKKNIITLPLAELGLNDTLIIVLKFDDAFAGEDDYYRGNKGQKQFKYVIKRISTPILTCETTVTLGKWKTTNSSKNALETKYGVVTVNTDGTTLFVTYTMDDGFGLDAIQLFVGSEKDFNQNGGNSFGNFPYNSKEPLGGVASYTREIPLSELDGSNFVVVAKAELSNGKSASAGDEPYQPKGNGNNGNGNGNGNGKGNGSWFTQFYYSLCF